MQNEKQSAWFYLNVVEEFVNKFKGDPGYAEANQALNELHIIFTQTEQCSIDLFRDFIQVLPSCEGGASVGGRKSPK